MPVVHEVSGSPKPTPEGNVALCLSGGGFRASLFHLGALRRLNELGILKQVNTICSVSGGSIIAAHLAKVIREVDAWPIPINMWNERMAIPFHRFTGRDISTSIFLRKYLPWNAVRSGQRVQWLEHKYHSELTKGMMLSELPHLPRFLFCATDLSFGGTWIFSRVAVGNHNRLKAQHYGCDLETFPVARAVAASSCFPPVFGPLKLPLKSSKSLVSERQQPYVLLSDGGVRDNMGVDPVWERYEYVIVSDGGAPFRFSGHDLLSPWLGRTLAIVQQQTSAVRKRWLVSEFRKGEVKGTYWGIAGGLDAYPKSKEESAYSRELAESVLSRIRTDLNAFSPAECQILENHGYMLANAASKSFLEPLIHQSASGTACIPYRKWFDGEVEDRIRKALQGSHRRITLRRLFGSPLNQPLEGEA